MKDVFEQLSFVKPMVDIGNPQGHEVVTIKYKVWEVVSSHTARRSAATNMWSSSEGSRDAAWYYSGTYGYLYFISKITSVAVRGVTAF